MSGRARCWPSRPTAVLEDEATWGCRLRRVDLFETIGRIGELTALLVRPGSSAFSRRRAERVSRLAIREPSESGGFDSPTFYADDLYQHVPSLQTHALVGSLEGRGVLYGFRPQYRGQTEATYSLIWGAILRDGVRP